MFRKVLAVLGLLVLGCGIVFSGEIPLKMHYSAELSTTSEVNVDFYITSTTVHSDSAYLWHESTSAVGGEINYLLGSNTAIPRWIFTGDSTERYLEVRIDGQSSFSQLVSMPYAYRASYANELAGGATVQGSIKINGKLDVGNYAIITSSSLAGVSRIEWADGTVQISSPTPSYWNKYNNMLICDLRYIGNMFIGSYQNWYPLISTGVMNLSGYGNNDCALLYLERGNAGNMSYPYLKSDIVIKSHSNNHKLYIEDQDSNNSVFTISKEGNVGIGNIINPDEKLEIVDGNVKLSPGYYIQTDRIEGLGSPYINIDNMAYINGNHLSVGTTQQEGNTLIVKNGLTLWKDGVGRVDFSEMSNHGFEIMWLGEQDVQYLYGTGNGNILIGYQYPPHETGYKLSVGGGVYASSYTATYGDIVTQYGKFIGDGSGLFNVLGSSEAVTISGNQILSGIKTFTSSITVNSGNGIYCSGDINVASGKVYKINGSQIASSNLSDASNVELLNSNQIITGVKTFTSSVTISANAFSVGGSTFVVKNGNIGIGVSSPTYTLQVNGSFNLLPPGMIMAYGGTTAPEGWLLCDGSQISRTTYAALFSAIGSNFGSGDGSSTFHLPDFRGRFLRGRDGSAGRDIDVSSRTVMNTGGNAGDNVGSIQTDAFKSHRHYSAPGNFFNCAYAQIPGALAAGTYAENNPTSYVGESETRPVNAYVNYIIKY